MGDNIRRILFSTTKSSTYNNNMYLKDSCKVRSTRTESDWFDINTGLK